MVPTFKMHGSKARTARWICSHMPRNFSRWIEPFAGRGNVFFRAASCLRFDTAVLNDLNMSPFLTALRDYNGDWSFVDAGELGKPQWERWKNASPSHERALAESYVARFGSSYETGPTKAGGSSKNGHSRDNTIRRMKAAQVLLNEKNARISDVDWLMFLQSQSFGKGDVVYLDPPYNVKQNVHFGNVDHNQLLETVRLLSTKCQVFLSGYSTRLYEEQLYDWCRSTRVRASVGKGVSAKGAKGKKPKVTEVLWYTMP